MDSLFSRVLKWVNKPKNNRSVAEPTQFPLRRIFGKHRKSGREHEFLYAGYNPYNLNMWGDHLFEKWEVQTVEPIQLNERTIKIIQKKYPDCSFLLIEKNLLPKPHEISIPHIEIPNWIQTWIDTSKPAEALCRPTKTGMNNARRLIKKYNMSCVKADKPEDRRHFYEHMYLPYLRKNTGRYLRELPFEDIFSSARPDQLYHIKMEGKLVGGAVATFGKGKARLTIFREPCILPTP
jgi:hypothetical protein